MKGNIIKVVELDNDGEETKSSHKQMNTVAQTNLLKVLDTPAGLNKQSFIGSDQSPSSSSILNMSLSNSVFSP